MTREDNAPSHAIEPELSSVQEGSLARATRIGELLARVTNVERRLDREVPSYPEVKVQVDGIRSSLQASTVSKDKGEAFNAQLVDMKLQIAGMKPKEIQKWPLVTGGFGIAFALAAVIWNASSQVASLTAEVKSLRDAQQHIIEAATDTRKLVDRLVDRFLKPLP